MKKKLVGILIGIVMIFSGGAAGITTQSWFEFDYKSNDDSGLSVILNTTNFDGKTLYVGGSGPGNYSTIQDAVDNANDGDTVFVYDDSSPYYENVVVDKSIRLIGEDRDTTIIDGQGGENAVFFSADLIDITGFTLQNSDVGIGLWYGISSNDTIHHNNIINNIWVGIYLWKSDGNIISDNTIVNNGDYGILVEWSFNNNISENTIVDDNIGINIQNYQGFESNNNHIFHNKFINNNQNAYDQCSNIWDNGYPSGGNYWSDFDELGEGAYDDYSGENQDILGSDGIVDHGLPDAGLNPYVISGGSNQDRYPLITMERALFAYAHGPYTGFTNYSVQFTGSAVGGTPLYNWAWNFGDGHTSYLEDPTHYYTTAGNYTVTLTVTDDEGNSDCDITTAAIVIILADAHGPYKNFTDEPVRFTGSADGGVPPYNYSWDFGDGNISYEQNTLNTYTEEGNYTVKLTVTDYQGDSDTDTTYAEIHIPTIHNVDKERNYWTIQEAVDDADPGNTILVFSGIYYENIVIDTSINLIGENRNTTVIDGSDKGDVVSITTDGITISGFTIQNSGGNWFDAGIDIRGLNYNTISNCNISSNKMDGIALLHSSDNNIVGNIIFNNSYRGIHDQYSSDNTISDNTILNNGYGIRLALSNGNNNIIGNTFLDNDYGVYLDSSDSNTIQDNIFFNDGLFVADSYQNTVEDNMVNGKPLVYMEDESGRGRDIEDAGQVILVNCDHIDIQNQEIANTTLGIELWNTDHCLISENNISDSLYGIGLYNGSTSNNIQDNIISSNSIYGIRLDISGSNTITSNTFFDGGLFVYDSYQNTVEDNMVNSKPLIYIEDESGREGIENAGQVILVNCDHIDIQNQEIANTTVGIELWNTDHCLVLDNNILYCSIGGIYLENSSNDNTISGNRVRFCDDDAIDLWFSDSNIITENNLVDNSDQGIVLVCSDDNVIYHNNFINNCEGSKEGAQAWESDSSNNAWDTGYPTGGNYWSNFDEPEEDAYDDYQGENQDIPGGDGIVDRGPPSGGLNPYNLFGGNNKDWYPLMYPWGWIPPTTMYVDDDNTEGPWDGTIEHPYRYIQDGIDSATTGATVYVFNGTYYENVVVGKSINLIGENKGTTIIVGSGNGKVVYVTAPGVTVESFRMRNGEYGLRLDSSNNTIMDCDFSINHYGIYLSGSLGNSIVNCSSHDNRYFGIDLKKSSNNQITGCDFYNNYQGIVIEDSSNNNHVTNSDSYGNLCGISIGSSSDNDIDTCNFYNNQNGGLFLTSSSHNIVTNSCSYNNGFSGIHLLSHANNNIISHCDFYNNVNGIHIEIYSDNNIISNCNVHNNDHGSYLYYHSDNNHFINCDFRVNEYGAYLCGDSDNNTIMDCDFSINHYGVYLDDSHDNTIGDCMSHDNRYYGINLKQSTNNDIINCDFYNNYKGINLESNSNNNQIQNNELYNNHNGISIGYSTNNNIENCVIYNNQDGIFLTASTYNQINNNHIYNNAYAGILLLSNSEHNQVNNCDIHHNTDNGIRLDIHSNHNTINDTNVCNNQHGIYLYYQSNNNHITNSEIHNNSNGISITSSSNENQIYHNNFRDNTVNAWDECDNTWDDGYPSGGNYWSDYNGIDNYHGPSQDILGGDGIGDTPYPILGGSDQDRYPFIEQDGWTHPPTNQPPETPDRPAGPTIGWVGVESTYTTNEVTDPNGDDVFYLFDWGDGTNSSWKATPSASHVWNASGYYSVKVKAKDEHDAESDWSPALSVMITTLEPTPKVVISPIGGWHIGARVQIANTGDGDATNVQWTMKVTGGIFHKINKTFSGTLPTLISGNSTEIKSGIFVGFGNIQITVTATCDEGSSDSLVVKGTIVLIFVDIPL